MRRRGNEFGTTTGRPRRTGWFDAVAARAAVRWSGIDAVARPELAKQLVGAQLQAATLQDKITPRQALEFFASFYRAPAGVDGVPTERSTGTW